MFGNMAIFQVASGLAEYATARQGVVAQNIANADTPGYRAKDLESFEDSLSFNSSSMPLRTTREKHFAVDEARFEFSRQEKILPGQLSPNGNSVSLEEEMIRAADIQFRHNLALTVYKSGLSVLRSSLGGGR